MFGVLRRNPRFRRLWSAQVVSLMGDWFNRVAALTLIGRLGGGGAALGVGLLFGVEVVVRFLPIAALGPVAGPVADRVPRRVLMVVADLVRAGAVLLLLVVRERGDLWLLYCVLTVQMGVSIFFESARSASVPNTLDDGELHEAYALSSATWSTMLAVGALCGGVLVEVVGVYGVFVLDAATYVASAALLLGLKLPAMPKQAEAFRWRDVLVGRDLRRGLDHVRAVGMTHAVVAKAAWGGAGGFLVVLAIAAKEGFGAGSASDGPGAVDAGLATGILYSVRGLGTGVGPFLGRWLLGTDERGLRRQVSWGFVTGATGYAAFSMVDALPLAAGCVFVAHLGGSAVWVGSTILWQRRIEDAFRGRVFALEFLAMTVSVSLFGLTAGLLYDVTESLRTTTLVVCAIVLVCGATWTVASRRTLGHS